MLLLHQTGSVHVGEVVRYTLTYTPSADRILPAPQTLHVKVKNTSAIPLRAAYLHGPYTLSVACYPSTFNPNIKHDNHEQEGAPDFEPNLKAGGQWNSKLSIPGGIRDTAGSPSSRHSAGDKGRSFSWIIEVASQVIFSTSAGVHFDVLVGRDERSVELGFYPVATGPSQGGAGKVADHIPGRIGQPSQGKGIYSQAVKLVVDDTATLWNSPPLPTWPTEEDKDDHERTKGQILNDRDDQQWEKKHPPRKKQKIHLVIVTHGIHANVGADLLYVKESIDATAKQAREDANTRRAQRRAERLRREGLTGGVSKSTSALEGAVSPPSQPAPEDQQAPEEDDDTDDDEQVIVRGFGANVVRTERGIQYLGKRLAKYVLSITYPDQPHLPVKSSISRTIARSLNTSSQKSPAVEGQPSHKRSSIHKNEDHTDKDLAYRITSISFIGHSLGGLTQTYAIAYIKKHSPDFFTTIKPINFVAMASPFLGLSNENPIYVKFALDFGLVGRTGQDLGLTWRAPTVVRSGWGAMIGGLGNEEQKTKTVNDPGAKPLLRILPTGPAHAALKLFRNRSIYSNVVNDGIVPLRTSCLLFLDWRGLERVEKARRDDGLVGTMVGWGWAEMTGQNASSLKSGRPWADLFGDSGEESDAKKKGHVPQPQDNATVEDDINPVNAAIDPDPRQFLRKKPGGKEDDDQLKGKQEPCQPPSSGWAGLWSFFRPQIPSRTSHQPSKHTRIYHRGQTTNLTDRDADGAPSEKQESANTPRAHLVRGPSLYSDSGRDGKVEAPPKTTFFESAGDLLKPPLPSRDFLLDPAARPRTIFHDRVYHPDEIPLPAAKERPSFKRRSTLREATPKSPPNRTPSVESLTNSSGEQTLAHNDRAIVSDMKIEEKIARAYHRDLSWRKVLVRLEPDAHNNMIVRRMFANAYGWPVIKHMCDTHFGFTASAAMPDAEEGSTERVPGTGEHVSLVGEHVEGQRDPPPVLDDDEHYDDGSEHQNRRHSLRKSATDGDVDTKSNSAVGLDLRRLRGPPPRSDSEIREATDEVTDLSIVSTSTAESNMSCSVARANSTAKSINTSNTSGHDTASIPSLHHHSRCDSARWSDRFFDSTDDDNDDDDDDGAYDSDLNYLHTPVAGTSRHTRSNHHHHQHATAVGLSSSSSPAKDPVAPPSSSLSSPHGTSEAEIADFLGQSAPTTTTRPTTSGQRDVPRPLREG